MPRAKKPGGPGGVREGSPGGQYANRSDLRSPGNTVAPGQEYGERAKQQASQQVVPLTPPPGPGPSLQGGAGPATQPSTPGVGSPGPTPGPAPGELKFTHPTERPNEPITAGLPTGPGGGPEVLNSMPLGKIANNMGGGDTAAALITQLASSPNAGAVLKSLAAQTVNGPIH